MLHPHLEQIMELFAINLATVAHDCAISFGLVATDLPMKLRK
jgi:hypothetical protein